MSVYLANPQPGGENSIIDRAAYMTRQVWWVDSTHAKAANATGMGGSPNAPLATLAYLITNAAAMGLEANARVILMPGHNEGIADAQIVLATAGLQIVGHEAAVGSIKPIIDFDHANSEISITANNVKLAGVNLRPSITDVLIGIEVDTDVTGTVIEDVEHMIGEDGAGVDEFVKAIRLVGGNDDTVFRNVKILAHASAAGATHGIHVDAASDRLVFDNVVIDGPYATGGIVEDATGVNHVVVNSSVDVSGTDYSFEGSSTFAKRTHNLSGGAAEDTGANFIGVDNNDNAVATTNVVANADGSVLERQEYIQDQVALTQAATGVGSVFLVSKTVNHNTAVAGGADVTGVSGTGAILIEQVIIQNGATEMDSAADGAVLNLYSDNVAGSGSFFTMAEALGLANAVISNEEATTGNQLVLETGKKILYSATTEDFTSSANVTIHLVCRRLAAGATLAAA